MILQDIDVVIRQDEKKYKIIPDESFKKGASLIIQIEKPLTPSQKKSKAERLQELEPVILFGDYPSKIKEEYDALIKNKRTIITLKCPFCEKYISNTRHLQEHNIKKELFIQDYGGVTPVEIVSNKIMQWYSPNRNKWAMQNDSEIIGKYYTYTTENQKEKNRKLKEEAKEGKRKLYVPEYLNINLLKGHINNKHTIAIYPWGNKAGWICFDVDTEEDSLSDTFKIVNTMVNYGINRNDILISFSGNKGYHIELFFEYPMTYKQIKKFGNKICFLAGSNINKKRKERKIEIRPTENAGIKLPFGLHRLANKRTYLLNENMVQFEFTYQEYIFFLKMDKVNNNLIRDILCSQDQPEEDPAVPEPELREPGEQEKEQNEQTKNTIFDDDEEEEEFYEYKFLPSLESRIKAIENKFYYGLKKEKSHHFWAFKIAIWMRDIKRWNRDKAEEDLIQWTQNNSKYVKNEKAAIYDVQWIIKSIYDSGNKFEYTLEKGITARILRFYQHEIKLVKKIQGEAKKEEGAKTISPSLLFFTFICMSKYFARNPFFINREDLKRYSTLSNGTFNKWFKWLRDKRYFEIVKKGNSYQRQANEYFIPSISDIILGSKENISIDLKSNDQLNIRELYELVISNNK